MGYVFKLYGITYAVNGRISRVLPPFHLIYDLFDTNGPITEIVYNTVMHAGLIYPLNINNQKCNSHTVNNSFSTIAQSRCIYKFRPLEQMHLERSVMNLYILSTQNIRLVYMYWTLKQKLFVSCKTILTFCWQSFHQPICNTRYLECYWHQSTLTLFLSHITYVL